MSILQRLRNNIEAIKYALKGIGNANTLDMYSGFGGIGAVLYIGMKDLLTGTILNAHGGRTNVEVRVNGFETFSKRNLVPTTS